jgi:LysM repeat protein
MNDYVRPTETPDPDYEWDDEPRPRGPRILWGRVIALGVFLFLAFFIGLRLGRATAPDASQADVNRLNDKLVAAQQEIDSLQAQLASPSPTASETPSPTASESPAAEGQTYTVKSGDTLQAIADKFYGDVGLAGFLAKENGVTDPGHLLIGTELTIPPKP